MNRYEQNNNSGNNNMSFHTNNVDSVSESEIHKSKRFDRKAKVVTILISVGTLTVGILTFVYKYVLN